MSDAGKMTMQADTKNDGGPAFPTGPNSLPGYASQGMSLRDWFAGQALTAMATGAEWTTTCDADMHMLAQQAYVIADAMLTARENTNV